jgi:ABC-type bacteriocin/lantibiotic exporter with double-glycine peptidase domain
MSLLRFERVSFHYPDDEQLVIHDLSFSVKTNETVQIAGRNGSGKTTLLRLASGELRPTAGQVISADGVRSVYLDQFSMDMLAPDLTLAEHGLAFSDQARSGFIEMLVRFELGLETRLHAFAGELSGGQRQILAIVITLLRGVQVLCLDEFTSNLDPRAEESALRLLQEYQDRTGAVILFVAHKPLSLIPTRSLSIDLAEDVE